MKKSLKILLATALSLSQFCAFAQQSVGFYSLPSTSIKVNVDCTLESFTAGKYAAFAKELLGEDVRTGNEITVNHISVDINAVSYYDPCETYPVVLTDQSIAMLNTLRNSNLIDYGCPTIAGQTSDTWEHLQDKSACHIGPIPELDEEADSIKKTGPVLDPTFQAAKDAAERIESYRKDIYRILIGDTDATYSGEALQAAVDELRAMESSLLKLFRGSSTVIKQSRTFSFTPTSDGLYPTFKIDPAKGLVAADKKDKNAWTLKLTTERKPSISEVCEEYTGKNKEATPESLSWRVPAVCSVSIAKGNEQIAKTQVLVYQLGETFTYKFYNK